MAKQLGAAVNQAMAKMSPVRSLNSQSFPLFQGRDRPQYGNQKKYIEKPSLTERLIAAAPNLDIYIIPDTGVHDRTGRAK